MGCAVGYLAPERPVTVVAIANAMEPLANRSVRAAAPGRTVRAYVAETWPLLPDDKYLAVVINGVLHYGPDVMDVVALGGDSLALMIVPGKGGGGKNPIMMVAMIAITIYTGGAGFGMWAAEGMVSTAMGFEIAMAAGAIGLTAAQVYGVVGVVVGGALMSAVMGGTGPSDGSNTATASLDQSATYSWGLSQNPITEGGPVPYMYGTARITPPCIGRFVSDGDSTTANTKDQYLNLLFLLADHQIDSCTDVWLNGNPSSFYADVVTEIRLGTPDQTAVPFFHDTISQKSSGSALSATAWTTIRTDGNAVQGLGVCIANDKGLFYSMGSTLQNASVTVHIQYSLAGLDDWKEFGIYTITDATTSPKFSYYRKDNLAEGAGQYDVRAQFTVAPSTGLAYQTRATLSYIHEIVYDDFTYPGRALLAVKIKATDQLSGSTPSVSCIISRSTVSVSDGTTTYVKPAANPAWASLDLLQSADYGGQVAPSRCIWADFEAWANWCTTKGYTLNIYADVVQSFPKFLAALGVMGRGTTIQVGSKFTCLVDRPVALPVQKFLFNMSNIQSLSQTWAPMEGRANSVEVTYFDATADYSRQVVEVHADDFDTSQVEVVKQSASLMGCTDRAQAVAYAKFLINCNRYLTNTISFNAGVDTLACTVGDVIDVQHDVPAWGAGGRVVSATAGTIVLDKPVTLSPGVSYALQVKLAVDDSRADVYIQGVSVTTTTTSLTIVGAWPGDIPAADDLWAFGPVGSVTKAFRIISMARNGDFQRKITALEYSEPVYDDATTIPNPPNQSSFPPVYALIAAETYDVVGGVPVPRVGLGWKGFALSWDVAYRIAGETAWTSLGAVTYPALSVPGTTLNAGVSYDFRVSAAGTSAESTVAYQGGPTPPDITGLYSYLQAGNLFLAWDTAACPWTVNYEVRQGISWATAQIVYFGPANSCQINGAGTYFVAASLGRMYSTTPLSIAVTDSPLVANVIATWDEDATGWTGTRDDTLAIVGTELWLVGGGDFYADPDIWAVADIRTLGGVGPTGTYTIPAGHIIDVGANAPCSVVISYALRGEGVFDDFYTVADVYAMSDVYGGYGSLVSAQPQIRTYAGGAWGAWQNYRAGQYSGEQFEAQIVLTSTDATVLAILSDFVFSVDVPDRVDWHKGVSVPVEGLNFTHSPAFHAVPSTVVQILSAVQGDDDVLTAETVAGGTLFIYNAGSPVARTVNLIHQGY